MPLSDEEIAGRLRDLLAARSVALVGATEESSSTRLALGNIQSLGFRGHLHLVNCRGTPVLGRPSVRSCREIEDPVDVALLAVPAECVLDALRDAAEAGIRHAVVLAAGFGEKGPAGQVRQQQLAAMAGDLGILTLGPNSVGFATVADGVPAWFGVTPPQMRPGDVAIVSQSGATAVTIASLSARQNLGISHLVSTGNEAMIDLADVLAALIGLDEVRIVCAFVESIRRPRYFRKVVSTALEAGKAVVVLKTGSSEISAASAITHTGALVGADDVVDAAFRGVGVIRVRSFDEMVATAGLISHTGVLPSGGLALMTNSGGIAEVAADLAASRGVFMPPPAERGRALAGQVGLENPLDLTGLVFSEIQILDGAMECFRDDPAIALVLYIQTMLPRRAQILGGAAFLEHTARWFREINKPAALISATAEELTEETVALLSEFGVPYTSGCGLRDAIDAVANAMWWSARSRLARALPYRKFQPSHSPRLVVTADGPAGSWSEPQTLTLLADHGVRVVPWGLAKSGGAALKLAESLGYPVVVKLASKDIPHKTHIGGVVTNVAGPEEARRAFERVIAVGREIGGAQIDGAVVASMRPDGVDLIIGVMRDPDWGLTLAVGLGGSLVEVMADRALRLLPVGVEEIGEMLSELRSYTLLDGVRGGSTTERDGVVDAIAAIATLAETLGDGLDGLEVNPLRIWGERVEVLDALCVWRDAAAGQPPIRRSGSTNRQGTELCTHD